MATRLQNILTRARDSLADPHGERWSNERLIRLASEAQQDLARYTRILKAQADIPVIIGQHTYKLPSNVYEITRATFDDYKIPLVSYNELDDLMVRSIRADRYEDYYSTFLTHLDNVTDRWQIEEGGAIEAVVYDRRNMDEIRLFPIPNQDIAEATYTFSQAGYLQDVVYEANSPYGIWVDSAADDLFVDNFGVVTDADSIVYLITDPTSCNGVSLTDNVGFNSPYGLTANITDSIKEVGFYGDELLGIVTGIDNFSIDSPYGVVANMYTPGVKQEIFSSPYGIVTNISENRGVIRLWYIAYPADLADIEAELELPAMFDVAIKHYIVAHAFDDDMDTRYAEKSAKALQYYQRELQSIQQTNSRDGTRTSQYHNNYKGFL